MQHANLSFRHLIFGLMLAGLSSSLWAQSGRTGKASSNPYLQHNIVCTWSTPTGSVKLIPMVDPSGTVRGVYQTITWAEIQGKYNRLPEGVRFLKPPMALATYTDTSPSGSGRDNTIKGKVTVYISLSVKSGRQKLALQPAVSMSSKRLQAHVDSKIPAKYFSKATDGSQRINFDWNFPDEKGFDLFSAIDSTLRLNLLVGGKIQPIDIRFEDRFEDQIESPNAVYLALQSAVFNTRAKGPTGLKQCRNS